MLVSPDDTFANGQAVTEGFNLNDIPSPESLNWKALNAELVGYYSN